jgi:hypothetical protein
MQSTATRSPALPARGCKHRSKRTAPRCYASLTHGDNTHAAQLGRRTTLSLSALTLLAVQRVEAAAPSGVELAVAVKSVISTRNALRRYAEQCSASGGQCGDRAALKSALATLDEALPVVAASATDFGRPQMDLSIAVFALLDRAVDGASYECVYFALSFVRNLDFALTPFLWTDYVRAAVRIQSSIPRTSSAWRRMRRLPRRRWTWRRRCSRGQMTPRWRSGRVC